MHGQISMIFDSGWSVFASDGSRLDTTDSSTDGLQEALDRAVAERRQLRIIGGEGRPILARETVRVPPLDGAVVALGAVTIDFSLSVTGDGLLFDSIAHSSWLHQGQVTYRGGGAAVRIHPRTAVRGAVGAFDSVVSFLRIHAADGHNPVGLHFDSSLGIIRNLAVDIREITGSLERRHVLSDGIRVSHPGAGQHFRFNEVRCGRIRGAAGAGIRVGENLRPDGAGDIASNRWTATILPPGEAAAGLLTWARQDRYELIIADEVAPFATGIYLAPDASRNLFVVARNDASAHPVLDESTTRDSRFLG